MKSEVIRHWLPCVAKNWNWSRTHATVKLESKIGNLQRKQNWTAKSTNFQVKENAEKSSQLLSSEQPSEPNRLDDCLEYCRSWKNTLGKLAVAVYTGGQSIQVLDESSFSDHWWKFAFSVDGDSQISLIYSWDTVGCEL